MMFTTVTTVWPWIISSICCCLPPAQTEHIIPHIHIIWSSATIRRIVSGLNGFSTASKAETFVAIVLQPHLPFSRSEAIFLILFTVRMHGFSFSSQVFRPFTFTPPCWVFFLMFFSWTQGLIEAGLPPYPFPTHSLPAQLCAWKIQLVMHLGWTNWESHCKWCWHPSHAQVQIVLHLPLTYVWEL